MEHLQHVARSIQISHPKSFHFLHEIDQDRPTKFTQTIALQALHPPSLFNQFSHFNKASSSADPVQNAIQAFSECHSNVIAKTSCINVQESVHKYVSMANKNCKSLACCSFQLFPVLRVLDIASQRQPVALALIQNQGSSREGSPHFQTHHSIDCGLPRRSHSRIQIACLQGSQRIKLFHCLPRKIWTDT